MKRDTTLRNLVLIPGDQLDERSAAFDGFDPAADAVWMAEVAHESEKVWVAKPRIAIFLAAMRHFRYALGMRGWRVFYRALTEKGAQWSGLPGKGSSEETFGAQLAWTIAQTRPARLILVEPGEWSVREEIAAAAKAAGVLRQIRSDRHFLCTAEEFSAHAKGRKQLRMEFFTPRCDKRRVCSWTPVNPPAANGTSITTIANPSAMTAPACFRHRAAFRRIRRHAKSSQWSPSVSPRIRADWSISTGP